LPSLASNDIIDVGDFQVNDKNDKNGKNDNWVSDSISVNSCRVIQSANNNNNNDTNLSNFINHNNNNNNNNLALSSTNFALNSIEKTIYTLQCDFTYKPEDKNPHSFPAQFNLRFE
jgi:hypothetical protein